MAEPSVPELPFVDDLLSVASQDMEASRILLQRLLAIEDAFLATAVTIAGLFVGFAFSGHHVAIALVAVPLVLTLGYLSGANWVHFRRVSRRIRSMEHLFHAYVVALRETKTVRPLAISSLRAEIDRYQFGIERTFEVPGAREVWFTNWRRLRWWLYPSMAIAVALCGALWVEGQQSAAICVTNPEGTIVRLESVPSPVVGEITVVPCPTALVPAAPTQGTTRST